MRGTASRSSAGRAWIGGTGKGYRGSRDIAGIPCPVAAFRLGDGRDSRRLRAGRNRRRAHRCARPRRGLDCDNGIVVDEYCRTSDPHIWAAGDCARHPSIHYGARVRLESVDNAFEQGTSAALNMLGLTTVHDKVPWFWSDQYDLKMVIVGLAAGARRGGAARRSGIARVQRLLSAGRRADRGGDRQSHQGPDGGPQDDPGAGAAGSRETRRRGAFRCAKRPLSCGPRNLSHRTPKSRLPSLLHVS